MLRESIVSTDLAGGIRKPAVI